MANQCNQSGTPRTEDELLCIFADNNQGGITAQDMRDLVVSVGIGQSKQGPQGNQGATGVQGPAGADGTGVSIKGSYSDLAALSAAQPTGNPGDAYIIGDGHLAVWNGSSWQDVGNIQGPQEIGRAHV